MATQIGIQRKLILTIVIYFAVKLRSFTFLTFYTATPENGKRNTVHSLKYYT